MGKSMFSGTVTSVLAVNTKKLVVCNTALAGFRISMAATPAWLKRTFTELIRTLFLITLNNKPCPTGLASAMEGVIAVGPTLPFTIKTDFAYRTEVAVGLFTNNVLPVATSVFVAASVYHLVINGGFEAAVKVVKADPIQTVS